MKGLAIYTLILMSFMAIYVIAAPEYVLFTKLICLGFYTPTFILAIKVIQNG